MNDKIYLHTINNGYRGVYTSNKQLDVFEQILKSGELQSLRIQGKPMHATFSGLDYISLADYEKRFVSNKEMDHYNTFNSYTRDGISFVFPHENIEVIEPTIIGICGLSREGYDLMYQLGLSENERYSDLPDEVQVKDRLSLEKMSALTFPVESFLDSKFFRRKSKKLELIKREIEIIKELLYKYNYSDIGIYDIDSLGIITDDYLEDRIMLTKTK